MSARLLTAPNLLSLSRLPLAVAFLLTTSTPLRLVIVVAAAATDFVDGWWARTRRAATTRLGAALDPITDKIFVLTALVSFAVDGVLSWPQLLLLLARDIHVSLGAAALLALRKRVEIRARFAGKVVTTLQLAAVLVLLLMPGAATVLVIVVAAAASWAIVDYTRAALAALRAPAPPR
ncbi:MAG TPA: CDP-alcohol phosphatidyltransferase family protein [Longimicrobiales bacterium]|nr:CDP-alcohol phosphatidyltransferase family protein [Longimicrobiales bacterium]